MKHLQKGTVESKKSRIQKKLNPKKVEKSKSTKLGRFFGLILYDSSI